MLLTERDLGESQAWRRGSELSRRPEEREVLLRHSNDGKQTVHKYMSLELSGEIKTGDKNRESSENTGDMKPWGWIRSPGRKIRIK